MRNQLVNDRRVESGIVGIQQLVDEEMGLEALQASDQKRCGSKKYVDDITGQELDHLLVEEARRRELEYFESKNVWEITTISNAIKQSGR